MANLELMRLRRYIDRHHVGAQRFDDFCLMSWAETHRADCKPNLLASRHVRRKRQRQVARHGSNPEGKKLPTKKRFGCTNRLMREGRDSAPLFSIGRVHRSKHRSKAKRPWPVYHRFTDTDEDERAQKNRSTLSTPDPTRKQDRRLPVWLPSREPAEKETEGTILSSTHRHCTSIPDCSGNRNSSDARSALSLL